MSTWSEDFFRWIATNAEARAEYHAEQARLRDEANREQTARTTARILEGEAIARRREQGGIISLLWPEG